MIQLTREEAITLIRNLSALEGGLTALSNDYKAVTTLLNIYMDYNVQLLINKLREETND